MARSDPLLPNAGIVARREYRDRTRSPLFLASTVLLAILAMMVAVAPIALRYLDRQTVTRIGVVSADPELARRAVAIADTLLNVPPGGVADPEWERPYAVEVVDQADRALALLQSGDLGGYLVVDRLPSGQVDIKLRTFEGPASARSQILSVASFGIGVLDWSARLPPGQKVPFVASDLPGRVDERRHRRRQDTRRAGVGEPRIPRDHLRRPVVHHDRDLRDVGGDGGRGGEEQPGHGADDQRGLSAPDADREGRRDRGGGV